MRRIARRIHMLCAAVTPVLVVFLALLTAGHLLAEENGIDWKALIQLYEGRGNLTTRERFELAMAYANTGDVWGARREFETLERLGWREDAATMIAEAEEKLLVQPDSLMDLNIVAFASFALGDYEKSCATFERILQVDPSNDWPRVFWACTLGRLGRIDEGIEQLELVAKKHPFNLVVKALLIYARTQRQSD